MRPVKTGPRRLRIRPTESRFEQTPDKHILIAFLAGLVDSYGLGSFSNFCNRLSVW